MIWTKEELKKMKKKRFFINSSYNINKNYDNIEKRGGHELIVKRQSYVNTDEELINLFYTNDTTKITNLLNKVSEINYDSNNKEHYGIVTNLSKINPSDRTEIFTIFKELIGTFYSGINNFAYNFINVYENKFVETNDENQKLKLHKFYDFVSNNSESILDNLTNYINSLYKDVNTIANDELYKPLMSKLYNNSLLEFLNSATLIFNNKNKIAYHANEEVTNSYKYDLSTNFKRKEKRNLK